MANWVYFFHGFQVSATAVNEVEIIRLNIERFRRMLQTDLDETARWPIKKMLDEFESKLPAESAGQSRQEHLIHDQADMGSRARSFLDR